MAIEKVIEKFKINIFNERSLVEVGRFNAKIFVIVSTDLNFFFMVLHTDTDELTRFAHSLINTVL